MFDKPRAILDSWHEAVCALDLEKLCSLYHPQAILLPTFSSRIRSTPGEIRSYFETLAANGDVRVDLREEMLRRHDHGGGTVSLGGIYDWTLGTGGEPTSFVSRFSFVIEQNHPNPIVHHHSSQVPHAP